jgi:hypothetical protein
MEVLKRLVKEFWFPAIVAVAWTSYSVHSQAGEWTMKLLITAFGSSLFVASWFTGQFFRIKKQAHVDKNLRGIESRLETLVDKLEKRTADLLSHMTGGESFCYLQFGMVDPVKDEARLVAIHQGQHPIYDVHARIVDLECFERALASQGSISLTTCETLVSIGNLTPSHASIMQAVRLGVGEVRRFNVFFSARNGDHTLLIRMIKREGQWYSATRVIRGDQVLFEQVQDGFPGDLAADQEWSKRA